MGKLHATSRLQSGKARHGRNVSSERLSWYLNNRLNGCCGANALPMSPCFCHLAQDVHLKAESEHQPTPPYIDLNIHLSDSEKGKHSPADSKVISFEISSSTCRETIIA